MKNKEPVRISSLSSKGGFGSPIELSEEEASRKKAKALKNKNKAL